MSNTIRLSAETYMALENIREKRETFSQAVERIIKVYATMREVSDTLGPSHHLKSGWAPTPGTYHGEAID